MGASLVAQLVKNLSAMQENWVQSLDWTIPGWDLTFLTSVLEITGCGLSPLSLPLAFSLLCPPSPLLTGTGQGGLLRRNHRVKLTACVSSEPHPAALVRMLAGELGCARCHRRARA